MEKILEVPPRSRKLLDKVSEISRGAYESLFIPCAPAGTPMIDCFSAGIYLGSKGTFGIYSSIRTSDCTLNHIIEKIKTALEFRFRGVLITRGDPPQYGRGLNEYGTESVVKFVRRAGLKVDLGVIVSLRFQVEEIYRRLQDLQPDFVFVMRYQHDELEEKKLNYIVKEARDLGTRVYVFVLLGTESNIPVFNKLGQPYIRVDDFPRVVEALARSVDGIVVSSPLDIEGAVQAVRDLSV